MKDAGAITAALFLDELVAGVWQVWGLSCGLE